MVDLSIGGLRVVHAVYETGSFSAAAVALGYTQSAISRQVLATERGSGAELFVRGPRGVTPTQAGVIVARRAATVLEELDATERDIAGLHDRLAGRVSIGCFPSAAAVLVPRAIARLHKEHPELLVTLREGATPTQLRQVASGSIDIAVIGVGDELPDYDLDGLRTEALVVGRLLLAVPDQHRFSGSVTVGDLRDETWIVGSGPRGEPQFGAWPTLEDPTIGFAVREWQTRLGMVSAGLGISLIPELAASAIPRGIRLVSVDDPGLTQRFTVAATRPERSAAASVALVALVQESARLGTDVAERGSLKPSR